MRGVYVCVGMLLAGCINGVHSSAYIARSAIGLSFSEMLKRPVEYTVNMEPLGVCLINKASYKKNGYFFFAESICGEKTSSDCIIYHQVDVSGVVVNAWVDKELSELWQEERNGNKSLTLRCDEKARKLQGIDWRKWIKEVPGT